MSTRDAMIRALELAQKNLDNYKQVEKEWHMNDEVKPKRPRGNPNFIKKEKAPDADSLVGADPKVAIVDDVVPAMDAEYWLRLYSAVIGTYSNSGPAILHAAAQHADVALAEFKARYPQ